MSSIASWMPHKRRQTEKVLGTAASIHDYTTLLTKGQKFWQEEPAVVPIVHRDEVVTGALIARGRFRKTYEVSAIVLNEGLIEQDMLDTSESSNYVHVNEARDSLVDIVRNKRKTLVMKRIKKRLLSNPKNFTAAMADIMLEAKYLSRLNHPNILKLRGEAPATALWGGQHDSYFVLTDKVEQTLDVAIHETWAKKANKSTVDKSITSKTGLALQLARALEYLHAKRIIYRNLRPQNIGLLKVHPKEESIVQLFDFGTARELPPSIGLGAENEVFNMTQAVGTTFKYRAVEVTLGPHYNCKADVYSWAMVVYEMLTGLEPFWDLSKKNFVERVINGKERPSMESFSAGGELKSIIESAWKDDFFHRPTMSKVCVLVETVLLDMKGDGSEQSSPTLYSSDEQF